MVCQRSSNHKLKAIHNTPARYSCIRFGVSKIVKSQIESNSQHWGGNVFRKYRCVKDRQITNWKQFTTVNCFSPTAVRVCQRSSNHKLKAIHNAASMEDNDCIGVSKIVKSQIESNSQLGIPYSKIKPWCVKDRQITNWKQFTTQPTGSLREILVCQRSSNHKLKAIHNITLEIKN